MCEKDGVVKGFVIKEPEKYFIECSAPAPMEDEQKEQKLLPGFDDLTPEEKMNHPLYLEGFDVGREVGWVEAEQKPQSGARKMKRG